MGIQDIFQWNSLTGWRKNYLPVESFRAMNYWSNVYNAIKNIGDGQSVTLNDWIV